MILQLICLRKWIDMTEYVRFNGIESVYGQKNLLYGELDILNISKRIKDFTKLRQEELILRLTLKKKIEDFLENVELFDKLLPQDKLPGLDKKKKEHEAIKEGLSLEQEIEVIRRRLEKLENN